MLKLYRYYKKKLKVAKVKEINLSLLTIFSNSFQHRSKIEKNWFNSPEKLPSRIPTNYEISLLKKNIFLRMKHFPLQYIEKIWPYGEIYLKVKPPVFIPRIESSQIVDICQKKIENKKNEKINFFEIGTGSGAISCLLLKREDNIVGEGCDIFKKAYSLTKENLLMNIGESYQKIYRLNFGNFQILNPGKKKFNFIVSNPPYIGFQEYLGLEKQVKMHESRLALVSTDDGFWHVRKILEWSEDKLLDDGFVVFELDPKQIGRLKEEVMEGKELGEKWEIEETVLDIFEVERFVVLRMKSF